MMGAAILATLFFGLTPALQATRPDVVQAARHGFACDAGPSRLRNALIVVQVTASVLLLICAGVLVRGAARIGNDRVGIRTHDVLAIKVDEDLRSRVLAALASHPLVAGPVAAAMPVPLDGAAPVASFTSSGGAALQPAFYRFVSPDYFERLDMPLTRGRRFTEPEARAGAPVAIVSQALADRLWQGHDAVRQSLSLARDERKPPTGRIAHGGPRDWRRRERDHRSLEARRQQPVRRVSAH